MDRETAVLLQTIDRCFLEVLAIAGFVFIIAINAKIKKIIKQAEDARKRDEAIAELRFRQIEKITKAIYSTIAKTCA